MEQRAIDLEILAPAGGREQLEAAVRCGADAVYLGLKGFNARGNAENFGSLREAVSYCHARGVRVHVTLNTLVMDDELPSLLDAIEEIGESCADAVIVQDLAVARLVRERCPGLSMHASTQMTIHNASGAKALEALGFSRVVLARELSLREIARIGGQTSLALEAFVHGALCMSMSGACMLSSMLGGRSGNRGLCAQPCRLDFKSGDRHHALSLKDLCAIDHLEALAEAGVTSVKIEGRMKRPEYVAAAVTAVRQALCGQPYDKKSLSDVFSRSGFTDGYLTGKRDLSMFGIRTEEDAAAAARAHGALRSLYRREWPGVPVDMRLCVSAEGSLLHVTDGENEAQATGEAPQPAANAPTDHSRALQCLRKCGDTPFYLRDLSFETDGAWALPASAINAMRREALQALLSKREAPRPSTFAKTPLPTLAVHTPRMPARRYVRAQTAAQLSQLPAEVDRYFLPLSEITQELVDAYGGRLAAELPALVFPNAERALSERLLSLKQQGISAALCENIGAIRLAREAGLEAIGGAGLNILNGISLAEYEALGVSEATVSFELHRERIRRLPGALPHGAIVYGRLPLMRMRCCPAQRGRGCEACDGRPSLKDRKGVSFPLLCHEKAFVSLLNAIPLNLSDDPLSGIDFALLYFTVESPEECKRIAQAFLAEERPEGPRTRGLYDRKLL